MHLKFKKIILHNFLSFRDAEIFLEDKNYCLVTGHNYYKKDNALSNGSGKSTIWSAINYALTGETCQGISKGLKNVLVEDEEDCWVKLEFAVNKDNYILTRTHSPKNNLNIILNNEDISGKTFRESETILADHLPDLTKDLISSVMILGQGLPNKFSSFTPSGRKDLLEKLTKSEFMIEDIKERLLRRQTDLSAQLKSYSDSFLINNAQLNEVSKNIDALNQKLTDLGNPDFNKEITKLELEINDLSAKIKSFENASNLLTEKSFIENAELIKITQSKSDDVNLEITNYNSKYNDLNSKLSVVKAEKNSLVREISRLNSIRDVCPTCGQRLPNVHKADTSEQENSIKVLDTEIATLEKNILDCNEKHKKYTDEINCKYDNKIKSIKESISCHRNELNSSKASLDLSRTALNQRQQSYSKLVFDRDNFEKIKLNLNQQINDNSIRVKSLQDALKLTSAAKTDIEERLAVSKKIETLIKRDFRGYLLSNIVKYIDMKAKEYCKIVFKHSELDFYLDGNNIDVTYCKIPLSGLSGGEKTRVDLILQLAIRSMLQAYLNFSSNIIVLDECTDFLDKQSCKAMMELLEKELNTVESVFIISHHADELELNIDSELQVIKSSSGISEIA